MTITPMITNDAVVFGLLMLLLGAVFTTQASQHPFWQRFYQFVPALLMCYFLPSLLNSFGIVDGENSSLYYVASRYLLPACLVLLTLSIDLKAIISLGPKALILFLTGTLGIVIGGPLALLALSVISPELTAEQGPNAVWRGLTTVAGSWIGGGANQAAMKEVFNVGGDIFSVMVTVDIIVANIWMAVLLLMAANHKKIDAKVGADVSALASIKHKAQQLEKKAKQPATLHDYMFMLALAFGVTGFAHFFADIIALFFKENISWASQYSLTSTFFWLVVISTAAGISLSFTKARKLENVGASKVGTIFLYILIATIGLHMNILAIGQAPVFLAVGLVWMLIHASLMLLVAKLIKAPVFYMAVASQANVGGAASAPVVASAFHPSLAPVGVLLAVFGYGLGSYMAYICGLIMQAISVG